MKANQIAAYIDGAMRVLYNAEKKDFSKIFGPDDGPYLWHKFIRDCLRQEGTFICYLDYSNQRKLAEAAAAYAEKKDPRVK